MDFLDLHLRDMKATPEDYWRMAGARAFLPIFYQRLPIFYGPAVDLKTMDMKALQTLAYAAKFLPSPIFQKDRCMPTNEEAQRRYRSAPKAEEKTLPRRSERARILCACMDEDFVIPPHPPKRLILKRSRR